MVRVSASAQMEASGSNTDTFIGSSGASSNFRRYQMQLSASNFLRAPISAFLEYSAGLLRSTSNEHERESPISRDVGSGFGEEILNRPEEPVFSTNNGEVSIRIIDTCESQHDRMENGIQPSTSNQMTGVTGHDEVSEQHMTDVTPEGQEDSRDGESSSQSPISSVEGEASDEVGSNNRDSSYQRYDIQQAARWIEQVLPFALLLLVIFIRQHLQGFFVTIWIAAVMLKSNDILRKQTALKGERKIPVLVCISLLFIIHVVGVYWWFHNHDIIYPLLMLPPKVIPPFWHAVFIIMVNDVMARQAAMIFKCILLICYKNSRGRNYRKQGQMLTLVEYLLLLYRALLPTPVWYRFFLNKEYGSLFSSLMTLLYLTFKLTSVVEKVQSSISALKALSRKDVHYGSYATLEQVSAAGDLCAICQEKMHAPIFLRCKHIFCEDCVSEWFERERTCPLCRALVKGADLRSFSDGSTSLFLQLF